MTHWLIRTHKGYWQVRCGPVQFTLRDSDRAAALCAALNVRQPETLHEMLALFDRYTQ